MYRIYLMWRIWAVSRNLKRKYSPSGDMLLGMYYNALEDLEFATKERQGDDG